MFKRCEQCTSDRMVYNPSTVYNHNLVCTRENAKRSRVPDGEIAELPTKFNGTNVRTLKNFRLVNDNNLLRNVCNKKALAFGLGG